MPNYIFNSATEPLSKTVTAADIACPGFQNDSANCCYFPAPGQKTVLKIPE